MASDDFMLHLLAWQLGHICCGLIVLKNSVSSASRTNSENFFPQRCAFTNIVSRGPTCKNIVPIFGESFAASSFSTQSARCRHSVAVRLTTASESRMSKDWVRPLICLKHLRLRNVCFRNAVQTRPAAPPQGSLEPIVSIYECAASVAKGGKWTFVL